MTTILCGTFTERPEPMSMEEYERWRRDNGYWSYFSYGLTHLPWWKRMLDVRHRWVRW